MKQSKKIVVLTGAGISAESGLSTFRDSGGLWEGFDVQEVASIEGWYNDREKVLEFYNIRRKQADKALPNEAHFSISELEKDFEVVVVTQNVDSLHEKAGSTNVIHLHGELTKARSEANPEIEFTIGNCDINLGDLAEDGTQLRPAIVWFGEEVPLIKKSVEEVRTAEILLVVGTSLLVYPAAGLVSYAKNDCAKYIIDTNIPVLNEIKNWKTIEKPASVGVREVANKIKKELSDDK